MKKAVESRTVFCGTLLTRRAVGGEARGWGGGGARKRSGRRRAAAVIFEDRRRRRRRKGSEEEEGRLRRRGGVGGGGGGGRPAPDHGRRAICNSARGAYDLIVGRGKARRWFFTAPFGAATAAPPSEGAVAYAMDRMEGAVAVRAARLIS